jgi:hypothetical protein
VRHHQNPRIGRNNYGREHGLPGVDYACTICKQNNHITAKCSKNKNQAHIAHQVEVQVAAALAPFVTAYSPVNPSAVEEYTTAPSRMLLDSAASTTMTPDASYHHSAIKSQTLITVAKASTTPATARGPATLPTTPRPATLDVLVVPGIRETLLAASQVTKSSDILIQENNIYIIPQGPQPLPGRILAHGLLRNGVYEMATDTTGTARQLTTSTSANIAKVTTALHKTFNHAPAAALRRIARHYPDTTARLSTLRQAEQLQCTSCPVGKQTRALFPAVARKPPQPLDVISTDTAGPLPTSHDKARYLQIFQDRATRYLLSVPFSSKSAATIAIQRAIANIQLQTGLIVRRYHADNV